MFPDLEYLKQGFLETLSAFVLTLKNNSFPKSWETRRMFKKMESLCCGGLMNYCLQQFGGVVWQGKTYPRIWSVSGDMNWLLCTGTPVYALQY